MSRLSSCSTLYEAEVSPDELIYAILSGNPNQVQHLALRGVDILPNDAWITFEALIQGPDMINALTANPAIDLNPVIPGQMGDRVFHFLLRSAPERFVCGKVDTIKCLLMEGIEPLEPDRQGNTAFHILAARPGPDSNAILHLLLRGQLACRHGVDLQNGIAPTNPMEEGGISALMVAVRHNNEPSVRLLLMNGACPNSRGEFNTTPLSLAIMKDCVGVARILLEYGAVLHTNIVPQSQEMRGALGGPAPQLSK